MTSGHTALICASENGHDEALRLLLLAGADKDVASNDGDTALMYAAHRGHVEVLRLLLTAGANKGLANTGGWTALMLWLLIEAMLSVCACWMRPLPPTIWACTRAAVP